MTFKEWTAVIQIAGAIAVAVWLINDAGSELPATIEVAAERTLWALGFVIVFNIVASIIVAIAVSAARGKELEDERADERDKAVIARSLRNAYFVAAIGGLVTLVFLALGGAPAGAPYVLFGMMTLAGVVDAASRLLYYRIG